MATLETQIGFSVLVGAHLRGSMTGGDGWDGWTKVGRSFGAKRRRPPNVPDRRRPLCVLLFLVGRRLAADGAAIPKDGCTVPGWSVGRARLTLNQD
jgi:hypothetical protein